MCADDMEDSVSTSWAAAMEAELDGLAAGLEATRAAASSQLQELRAAALQLGQQQLAGVQDLQKSLAECLQDRYELQVRHGHLMNPIGPRTVFSPALYPLH